LSTTSRAVDVELYTALHRITGSVKPGAAGLFSHLNMPTESSLLVEQGSMVALHQITQEPETFAQLWMVKSEITAVLVGNRAGLGPASSVRAGYTKPFPHWVRIMVGGYKIDGQINSGGRFNFGAIMFEGGNTFIALYDATFRALLFPKVSTEAPALMFNRGMVQSMTLLPEREAPR
jgi:hypothetical protein